MALKCKRLGCERGWSTYLVPPFVCALLACGLVQAQCADDNYRKTDNGWSFERKQVEGADIQTFRLLTGPDPYRGYVPCVHDSGYAVDRFHAYWHGSVIPDAVPNTFSYLQFDYSRDAAHVYYRTGIVSGADPRTFMYIDGQYFKDSAHVYLRGTVIREADPATFFLLSKSWNLQDRLARDASHVFFGERVVHEANSKDVQDLGGPYWRSNRTIFFKAEPFPRADAASFRVASEGERAFWAEDESHYFLSSKQALNKSECRTVGQDILACGIYVWIFGRRFSHFDSASLHYLGVFPPKHCAYEGFPTYQDKRGVYIIDQADEQVDRFSHSGQISRLEQLDTTSADLLCRLGAWRDVRPDRTSPQTSPKQ
jgi:hypothetical protein